MFSETCQLTLGERDDASQSCGDCTVECGEDPKPLLDVSNKTDLGMLASRRSLPYLLL